MLNLVTILKCQNVFFYFPHKNHQIYAKKTDSDWLIIPKVFLTGDKKKNSLGRRGVICVHAQKNMASFGWLAVIELTFF